MYLVSMENNKVHMLMLKNPGTRTRSSSPESGEYKLIDYISNTSSGSARRRSNYTMQVGKRSYAICF